MEKLERCPSCGIDLSGTPETASRCPNCGTDLHAVIDLRTQELHPSVLIVDEDLDIREGLRAVLEAGGCRVVSDVSNGPDAVLVAEKTHPDFVTLDYEMRVINGEETARLIRLVSADSIVVCFSANLTGRPAWADAYLSKTEADKAPTLLRELTLEPPAIRHPE